MRSGPRIWLSWPAGPTVSVRRSYRGEAILWLIATWLLAFCGAPAALAGGGPENVLLVVNADNTDSVTIAKEYALLRKIPAGNVLELKDIPTDVKITIQQFRDLILNPILDAIKARGLSGQIDYVVYSSGFPFQIDVSAEMAGRKFPIYVTQPASITGLTYLYQLALAGSPNYLALDANWYFRRLKSTQPDTAWTEEDRHEQSDFLKLIERLKALRKETGSGAAEERASVLVEADRKVRSLRQRHPNEPNLLYDLACILALQGQPEGAMEMLTASYQAGWRAAALTEADPDLESLRSRSDFRELLATMRSAPVEVRPPHPFRHSISWGPTGEAGAAGGRQYYLSAMLGYIGGTSTTLSEAIDGLRRSAAADGTRPAGTVYFMSSNDRARTGPREWGFKPAAAALNDMGVKAEVMSGILPPNKPDVAGAVIGIAGFDWKGCGSQILPGAFCDHLTSFGAVMTGAGQTLLSEFLRNGAAGASGTVTEPYALQAKFPTPFLHVFYASGCSLAEAFYQSVQGPYQQLLIGDPLCRPWARIPAVSLVGLKANETLRKPRRLSPRDLSGDKVVRFELYVDGRRRQACLPNGSLTLNPLGLTAGDHEARVVAVTGAMEVTGRLIVPFRTAASR